MPRLTRRQLDLRWLADDLRREWLAFVAVAIPILTAAVVVAVIVSEAP